MGSASATLGENMQDKTKPGRSTLERKIPGPNSAGIRDFDINNFDTWVFDLDGTLYSEDSGILEQLRDRMVGYVVQHFGLPEETALSHLRDLLHKHGSSLLALKTLGDFEPADYVAHVCNVEVGHLPYNSALDEALEALPGRKVIFTNANTGHAERVLAQLRLTRHFDGIYDVTAGGYMPKPQPQTYDRFLALHDIDPRRAIFFEDTEINLKPALERGMTSVWITTPGHRHEARQEQADFVHHRAYDLAAWLRARL